MKSNSLPTWIFIYSLNYLFWHVGIIFLNGEIANKLVVADVLDLSSLSRLSKKPKCHAEGIYFDLSTDF